MLTAVKRSLSKLWSDRSGLALTEYLILLGLLTAAVIAAVLLFGTHLAAAWDAWATWVGDL